MEARTQQAGQELQLCFCCCCSLLLMLSLYKAQADPKSEISKPQSPQGPRQQARETAHAPGPFLYF